MARYRRKPLVVDAFRWIPGVEVRGEFDDEEGVVWLETPDGKLPLRPGDYVVRWDGGVLYPFSPDLFEASYELIEDENEKG